MTRTIELAIEGDVDAFELLVKQYSKYILYMCATMTNRNDYEDAAQEVILAVYKNIRTLRSPHAFTAWLRKIIESVCISFNRKNDRNVLYGATNIDALSDTEQLAERNAENLPEEAYESASANLTLHNAIKELPPSQRIVIDMHYYDGLKLREIAEELDIGIGTVASNMAKAKKNLVVYMEKRPDITDFIISVCGARRMMSRYGLRSRIEQPNVSTARRRPISG
jgi:RNA polymerase sigma-70 factor (ECF subfamily)